MKRAAVLGSVLAMVIILALVGWWKLGGFYTVTVINIFNLQSRLLPVTADEGLGTESYGGAALISSAVKELKKANPDLLVTESGDLVMGPWWRIWKGEPEFTIAEKIGVNAGILGNHEFNLGQQHLKEALASYRGFPILATNISFADQELADLTDKRIILTTAGGKKIGLFGLVPAQLATKTKAGEGINIDPDLVKIAAHQVRKLQKAGVQAIILLTHCSLEEALTLASRIEGLSLIISGDSYLDGAAEIRWVSGPGAWPTAVAVGGDHGQSISAFNLTLHRGRPIPDLTEIKTVRLNSGLKPDPEIEAIVTGFAGRMDKMLRRPLGIFATPVDARRDYVRKRPAPVGAFIADAYRWKTGADIAVINAGGIRGDRIFPSGPITLETVMEILPFQNQVLVKEMNGREIRRMLEYSASALIGQDDDLDKTGRINSSGFLYFSGLTASFSLGAVNKPLLVDENGEIIYSGNRVKFTGLLKRDETIPLNDGDLYTVAMPDFIADGGDKYTFLADLPTTGITAIDYEAVVDYLNGKGDQPLNLKSDNRLLLENY